MLLVALVVDNIDGAVDCIIHIWYSTFIRKSDLDILQQRIRPVIQSVCEKIKVGLGPPLVVHGCPGRPDGATGAQIRTAVTAVESRKDYRDRHLLYQPISRRIAKKRFWEDGLLLPFGFPRNEFQDPNQTFFQTADVWPMLDDADPLNGWSSKDVADCSTGTATADIYGKLFFHVRAVLRTFLVHLSGLRATFRLFQMDISGLPKHLESGSFNRIEVSNISDGGYLGIHHTLALMVPLLQGPLVNPHATLITLFMNAVDEYTTAEDRLADMTADSPTTKQVLEYLPPLRGITSDGLDLWPIKFYLARDIVATHDHVFDRFIKELKFAEAAPFIGAAVKEAHTVIEKWPFRLKLRPGQPGAQEEFDRALSGGVVGQERYVEWKSIAMYEGEITRE